MTAARSQGHRECRPPSRTARFMKPLFEFSGACAGCGETPYVKLVTQLFGDRMIIANATGCSSIYGGSAPTCPYTTNEDGHGPAWANSLFEDNAEFGFGMQLAITQRRAKLADNVRALIAVDWCQPAIKEAGQEWLENMDDGEKSKEAGAEAAGGLQGRHRPRPAPTLRSQVARERQGLRLRSLHPGPQGH